MEIVIARVMYDVSVKTSDMKSPEIWRAEREIILVSVTEFEQAKSTYLNLLYVETKESATKSTTPSETV